MKQVQLTLNTGRYLLLHGPIFLKILEGTIDVFGSILTKGDEVTVVIGRQLPIKPLQESILDMKIGDEGRYEAIYEDPIPGEWDVIYQGLMRYKKFKTMILGDVDVGKSSLILYLANRLVRKGLKIGIVDSDIGQSDIGPPGVIGLTIIDRPLYLFQSSV